VTIKILDKENNIRYIKYKCCSKRKNVDWTLTKEQFKTFIDKPCYFCNKKLDKIYISTYDLYHVVPLVTI
jgi:phage FluMu protein Com